MISSTPPKLRFEISLKTSKSPRFGCKGEGHFFTHFFKFAQKIPQFSLKCKMFSSLVCVTEMAPYTSKTPLRDLSKNEEISPRDPLLRKVHFTHFLAKVALFGYFLALQVIFGQSGQKMKIFIFLNFSSWLGRRLLPSTALRDHAENDKIGHFQSTFEVTLDM